MKAPVPNNLLAALSGAAYRRALPHLEQVSLSFGDNLYQPGARMAHVYFPGNSLVSLLTVVDGHSPLEVGLVGYEGMVGAGLALGVRHSAVRAVVQGAGNATRMKSEAFLLEYGRNLPLQRDLLHYIHSLMAQISQTAACNRFHLVEARLARWLLMTGDRVRSNQFVLTQEFLGHMLGVRRVGVTNAARALLKRNLISYSRGRIAILDRRGLEAASCQCYEVVRKLNGGTRAAPQ